MSREREETMPYQLITLGDFSVTVEPGPSKDQELVQWAARWNSGVTVEIVNPFYIEHYAAGAEEAEVRLPDIHHPSL